MRRLQLKTEESRCCPDMRLVESEDHVHCGKCGAVHQENTLVSHAEFSESSGGAPQLEGVRVGRNATSLGAANQSDGKEATRTRGIHMLEGVGDALKFTPKTINSAKAFFTAACAAGFLQGRKTSHVVGACLFIAARQQVRTHMCFGGVVPLYERCTDSHLLTQSLLHIYRTMPSSCWM